MGFWATRKFSACRRIPRRGQDARPTTFRKLRTKIENCEFPFGRRGGLQAARAILSCREQAVAASTHPCSVGRGLDPAVQIYLAHNVPVCRHIPRAAYTPPLHATGPCAANTKTTPAKLRRGGVKTPPYKSTEFAPGAVKTRALQTTGAAGWERRGLSA